MKRIGDVKKDLIKLGVVTAVGAVTVGGVYYSGYNRANEVHEQNILQSKINQEVTQAELKGTIIDALVDSINTKVQISLLEHNSTSNQKLHRESDAWNSFLTGSDIEVSVEYRSLVGIDTKDLMFVKTDKGLIVQYSLDDLRVLSLECVNENIITSRALFGKGYTDDDKAAIKTYIKDQTREKILQDKKVIKQANEALKDYLHTLADSFNVDIEIIDVK